VLIPPDSLFFLTADISNVGVAQGSPPLEADHSNSQHVQLLSNSPSNSMEPSSLYLPPGDDPPRVFPSSEVSPWLPLSNHRLPFDSFVFRLRFPSPHNVFNVSGSLPSAFRHFACLREGVLSVTISSPPSIPVRPTGLTLYRPPPPSVVISIFIEPVSISFSPI